MRPSHVSGEVTILEKPECKVLLDAFDDPAFDKGPAPASLHEVNTSTQARFYDQARQTIPGRANSDPGAEYEMWAYPAEFRVQVRDINVVMRAARRTLRKSDLLERVFCKFTGRTKAARAILETLGPVQAALGVSDEAFEFSGDFSGLGELGFLK